MNAQPAPTEDYVATLPELMREHPEVDRIVHDETLGHSEAARLISATVPDSRVHPESVRQRRALLGWTRSEEVGRASEPPDDAAPGAGRADVTATGGEFVNVVRDAPIVNNDFTEVFRLFKLDPEQYLIVDDTVRMSTWQQSKGLEDGTRSTVQLYSYSCRFRRRAAAVLDDDFAARRERVLSWRPNLVGIANRRGGDLNEPCTFVVNWADWQLGKDEGGGVRATEERVLASFEACVGRLDELVSLGRNVEGVALVNMGDPIEGCMGNYAAQTYSVELNQRQQLLLAMDLFTQGILTLSELAPKVDVIGVLCNHGEWNRLDGKGVTGDADNASGFLMEAVQRVVTARPDKAHLSWHVPRDEMITMVELSGVQNAFTHGHKITGGTLKAEDTWLASQSLHLLRRYGSEPRLWTTAHKHHAFLIDHGPWHRIQCSALDGGSKWYLDAAGQWAAPGTTTYLAGRHDPRGFSDYAVV